ncbi:hypothetical protein B0H13DRAFT_270613 [Mycena leptocephala]|nr:hypothetical protein B0H13DRAFT_270613 [Mycena leptocephala]
MNTTSLQRASSVRATRMCLTRSRVEASGMGELPAQVYLFPEARAHTGCVLLPLYFSFLFPFPIIGLSSSFPVPIPLSCPLSYFDRDLRRRISARPIRIFSFAGMYRTTRASSGCAARGGCGCGAAAVAGTSDGPESACDAGPQSGASRRHGYPGRCCGCAAGARCAVRGSWAGWRRAGVRRARVVQAMPAGVV